MRLRTFALLALFAACGQDTTSTDGGAPPDLAVQLPEDLYDVAVDQSGAPDLTAPPTADLAGQPPVDLAIIGQCNIDMDCGPMEYCTQQHTCKPLPTPGAVTCTSGTQVSSTCNMAKSASALVQCAGPPGPSSCPYCRDGSCYWPVSATGGACKSDGDCHGGDHCGAGGLCFANTPQPCVKTVAITDLIAGKYGAGKEVCIRDVVYRVVSETDGDFHVRMGNVSYPGQTFTGFVTEPTPQHVANGLGPAVQGTVQSIHGQVRWDEGHLWWEIHPVDYIGP